MRLVIQRVSRASVSIDGEIYSQIGPGLMVLVGVAEGDTEDDAKWLAGKTVAMRIFPDENGVMNRSLTDMCGEILAVSQFTLNASTRKGNRPSYIRAAKHDVAIPLYELYCRLLEEATLHSETAVREIHGMEDSRVKRGVFGADMKISLVNDGPVTIIIDSRIRE